MNYRQTETSREIRLWIGQIFIPITVLMVASPEARNFVQVKAKKVKDKVKAKFSK